MKIHIDNSKNSQYSKILPEWIKDQFIRLVIQSYIGILATAMNDILEFTERLAFNSFPEVSKINPPASLAIR